MKDKKTYEPATVKVVLLDRDMLITSAGTLGEGSWETFDFSSL